MVQRPGSPIPAVEQDFKKKEKKWVWRQGKEYLIKMSKLPKKKGRDFDWEKPASAMACHIGKLQSCTAKVPVSILKSTGAITWP